MKSKGLMLMVTAAMIVGMCSLANGIVNPSFEEDGDIFSINLFGTPPTGWTESISGNMDGQVNTDWSSVGLYGVKLFAQAKSFTSISESKLSQEIDVTDFNNLVFDFYGYSSKTNDINDWDPTRVTAFVAIDGNDIWNSPNDVSIDVLYNNVIDVSGYSGTVNMSFGIRVDKLFETFQYSHNTFWDNFRLTNDTEFFPCGGNGYLDTDLNYDCVIDFIDLNIIVDNWLREDFNDMPPYGQLIDIDESGKVDFIDYTMVSNDMGLTTEPTDSNAIQGDLVPLSMDVNYDANGWTDGTVDFADYAQLMTDPNDVETMVKIADEWLMVAPPNIKKFIE